MTKSVTKVQDKDTNKRLSVVRSTDDPTKYWVVILNPDGSKIKWPKGDKGDAATISVWTTTTWAPWTNASVTNSWTTSDAVFNFTVPRWATVTVGSTTTWEPWTNASVTNSWTGWDVVLDFTIPEWEKGDKWDTWEITVWTTTTGAAGTNASVVNSWTSTDAVLDFTIPKGDKWDKWDAATITVGSTSTGEAGTSASVTNSWTTSAAVFNFTIPKGDKGNKWDTGAPWAAATISAWTTTTGQAWTNASVTNSGTSSAAVFDFTIPKGDKWATGDTGNWISSVTSSKSGKITTVTMDFTDAGSTPFSFTVSDGQDWEGSGDVLWPSSSTDWHVVLFDWASWKLIKDSGKALPSVINNLTSTSTTDALSAAQGKALNDEISTLKARGRFLSNWKATTWLPESFPESTPYTYNTGDYFDVTVVGSTNYRPSWSSYTWAASTTVETEALAVWDTYVYDGATWLLQLNHNITTTFATISGQPTDNTNLATALNAKQDTLVSGTNIKTVNNNSLLGSWNVSIPTYSAATSSVAGIVKLWSDTTQSVSANAVSWTSDRTYAIQANSSGQMVVNVPRQNTTYTASSFDIKDLADSTSLRTTWSNKQAALVSWTNIKTINWNSILWSWNLDTPNTTYSQATDSTLWLIKLWSSTAQSTAANAVSSTADRTYALQVNSSWQWVVNVPRTDTTYESKAAASEWTDVSLVTTGEKYNWNNKQNALTAQTAYTSKWTATKVPTITTNTLWQVTAISETNISFPVTSVNGSTWAVTWLQSQHSTLTLTLASASWSSKSITVSATWVTASNTVIISPAPSSIWDYADGGVYCSAQSSNSLTFSCTDTPTGDIDVNVVIMN